MTENKPAAWIYDFYSVSLGMWVTGCVETTDPANTATLTRNVEPLYRHPPAPQPVTDPEVEAARRKALRAIFNALGEYPWACDTNRETGVPYGVLRDLVGQPRKYSERAIRGYDYDQVSSTPPALKTSTTLHETRINTADIAPLARLSVEQLASVIAQQYEFPWSALGLDVRRIARAVHEAVYGRAGDCGGPVGVSGAMGPIGQTGPQGAQNDRDADGKRPFVSFAGQAPWYR